MSTMFEYIKWRGDLSFTDNRFNEVDGAILSMISYIDFGAIGGGRDMLLRDAAQGYCPDMKYDSVRLGLIIPSKNINKLFCDAAASKRFGVLTVSDYRAKTSDEENCQFAAMSFHLPNKRVAVAFRGTDDSIVGWREDFCLSYLDEIPAQRLAVEYIEMIAAKYPDRRIYVCGHSKGGNLSMYATVNCSADTREKIIRAYCYDGPGLSRKMVSSQEFKDSSRKLQIYVPQSSYIGTMFERGKRYTVIQSGRQGARQHDSFSWVVDVSSFERVAELSPKGKKNEEQFRASMDRMTPQEKRDFVETFFSMVYSTGAHTLTDFSSGGFNKLNTLMKNYSGLDKSKRDMMFTIILRLFDVKRVKQS